VVWPWQVLPLTELQTTTSAKKPSSFDASTSLGVGDGVPDGVGSLDVVNDVPVDAVGSVADGGAGVAGTAPGVTGRATPCT
jgi:hypothetical protein